MQNSPPSNPPANNTSNQALSGAIQAALNPQQAFPFGTPGMPPPGVQFQQVSLQLQQQHPLFPPPDAIQAYEKVLPGAFDRIIKMAEKAQRDQAESVVSANESVQKDVMRGQLLGASISIVAMAFAMWCVFLHEAVVAAIFVSVPVMGVAKALIDSARAPKPTPTLPAPSTPHP